MKKVFKLEELLFFKLKIDLKMKLTTLFLLVSLFQLQANESYAQKTKISLNLENVSIEQVLNEIEGKTKFKFLFNYNDADYGKRISIKAKKEQVFSILERLLKDSNVTFQVFNKQIIIKKDVKTVSDKLDEAPNVVLQNNISGTVKDKGGVALPGVNIIIEGTTTGTQTDFDGKYIINAKKGDILLFSYLGFKSQNVTVADAFTIDLVMEEEASALDEIVVVGYGTIKKSDLTGSVSSIKSTAINERAISNLGEAIQGNVSGVAINSSSGAPGSDVQIRIRGLGSINSSVDPLYVVDGLPFTGSLNSINAYDIESMDILKDASSTAIYGSRGANGVILITTKKGSNDKLSIEYNSSYGVQTLRKKIDLLNATQYAQLSNEAAVAIGNPEPYSSSDIAAFHNNGEGTDWQDEIYQDAIIQTHQLSASGGNEKIKFYLSGNYLNQEGIIKTSEFEKYSMRVNLDAKINDKISIGNTLAITRQASSGVSVGSSTRSNSGDSNVVWAALVANPTLQIKDDNGDYIPNSPDPVIDNPVALIESVNNDAKATEIIGSLYLKYSILDWLSFKSTFGFGLRNNLVGNYTEKFILGSNDGSASRSTTQTTNWVSTNQLDFNKEFGEFHKLNGTLVAESQEVSSENFSAGSQGFVVDNLTFNNLGSGSNPLTPSSGASMWSLSSFALRTNYSFKNKYLLTLTGRYDGASRLADGNKWNLFPSGAVSWKISEEPFMESIDAINSLKFRASYGESGNQSVGVYSTLSTLGADTAIIGANESVRTGFSPTRFPNEALTWEISKQADIGIDASLFKGKVDLVFDYFNRKTEGLFFNRTLPSVVGTNNLGTTTNIGRVENSGIEIEADVNVVNSGDFSWNVTGNITHTKTKVLALAENDTIYTGFGGEFGQTSGSQILAVGGRLGVFRGWKSDGLYDSDVSLTLDGTTMSPGDVKYVDMDGDGDITTDDRVELGNALPDFFWGLTNTFSYKGISLTVFMQGSHGNKMVNLNRGTYLQSLDGKSNNDISTLNRWTTTNTDTNIPRASGVAAPLRFSDRWLEDASYIRLKTLTLGYKFPSQLTNKLNISSLGFYVTGTNLLTLTDYTGYDPDVARSSSVTQQGYDQGIYPQSKSFILGLNIGF